MQFHNEPMTQIWERLYLGCYYDAEQLKSINPYDINLVVNCTRDPIAFPKKAGAKYNIETITLGFDDGHPIPKEKFYSGLYAIGNGLKRGENVLVHCHAGISRSPSMIAAYLYWVGFASLDEAVEYIRNKRPIVQPHHDVLNSVKKHLGIWPYVEDAFK